MKSQDKCAVKGCKNKFDLIYYKKPICSKCFEKHCDNKINLKKKLNIKEISKKGIQSRPKPQNTLKTNKTTLNPYLTEDITKQKRLI